MSGGSLINDPGAFSSTAFSFTPGFSPVREQPPNLATVSTVFPLFRIETVETVFN
jgi:hypothetical protein